MDKKTMKMNPMLFLAVVLLGLVLLSSCFTSGLYARYATGDNTESSARVASFVINTDIDHIRLGTTEEPSLQLGGVEETQTVTLPFYIASESEVTVEYSVTVDFGTTALPAYLELTLSNGSVSQTMDADGTKTSFVFADFGTLAASTGTEQRAELVLTFSIPDLSMVTEELWIPAAELIVRVDQVD